MTNAQPAATRRGTGIELVPPIAGTDTPSCRVGVPAHLLGTRAGRSTGRHTCLWRPRLVQDVVDAHRAGYRSHQVAADLYIAPETVDNILAAHPGGRMCGEHTCRWAADAAVVDAVLWEYQWQEASIRRLSQNYRRSRGAITRMIEEHGVTVRSRSEQQTRYHIDIAEIDTRNRQGVSVAELAAGIGLSRQALSRRLGVYRRTVRTFVRSETRVA